MMGRNMRFKGVIWLIIPKLSLLPILIWSTAVDGPAAVWSYISGLMNLYEYCFLAGLGIYSHCCACICILFWLNLFSLTHTEIH